MTGNSTLFWRNSVAGAVAREIRNIEHGAGGALEGLAYKAEWDRRGSDAQKHCAAMLNDFNVPARRPEVLG